MKIVKFALTNGLDYKMQVATEQVPELIARLQLGGTMNFGETQLWIKHGSVEVITVEDDTDKKPIKEKNIKTKKANK